MLKKERLVVRLATMCVCVCRKRNNKGETTTTEREREREREKQLANEKKEECSYRQANHPCSTFRREMNGGTT